MSPTESSILHPPNISTQGLGVGPCLPGLLTFCNVPWDSSQEHLAGVDRVLVVSGRQLPAPGAGCFVHSLERTPVILSTGSFPSHSPTGLPIFPSYRLSRAAQPQAAALFSLHTLRARVRLGPGANCVQPVWQEQHLPSHSGRRQGSTGPSISLINFLLQLGELRLEPRGLQGPQVNGI